jgi:hypothetical protein
MARAAVSIFFAIYMLNYCNVNGGRVEPLGVNALGPCIGDPRPQENPATLTVGASTGTSYPPATVTYPGSVGGSWGSNSIGNLNVYANPLSPLTDFFNVQYLSVEAVCAVTRQKIKAGEPVLILDEHVISKTAFMKLLRENFERMMVPKIETMHEMTDYDS